MKKLTQIFILLLFITTLSYSQAPAGFTHIGDQWRDFNVAQLSHLAFGANGKFIYKYSVPAGGHYASHDFFGGNPSSGGTDLVYAISVTDAEQESAAPISGAINAILNHLNGSATLSKADLDIHAATVYSKTYTLSNDANAVRAAIAVVNYYETNTGPLFINSATKGGYDRTSSSADGLADDRAVFAVMQAIMSGVLTNTGMTKHSNLLNGLKFESSKFFPGQATAPSNSGVKYNMTIDATLNKQWGVPRGFQSEAKVGSNGIQGEYWPARRPTGCYVAPGSISEVTVPSALVNSGYTILVGAHTWSKYKKDKVQRLDNVWARFPITSTTMKIANPLGGNVYIEVPYGSSNGLQAVEITNVIKAPYYSNLPHRKTSDADWKNTERKHLGPWTDFESEKFMMSIPTSWIYNYDGAEAIMKDWDLSMEGQHELNAVPESKRNAATLFVQVDLSIAHGAYGVGYPQVNNTYNPDQSTNGNSNHFLLNDVLGGGDVLYHEMGHMQMNPMFPGETESIVHVPYTYIGNVKFGMSLDDAFNKSWQGEMVNMSRDQTAIGWMIRSNFRLGNPMENANSTKNEIRYQHKGHAKYAEIAALFGWDPITDVALEDNWDHMGTQPAINMSSLNSKDKRIFQFSNAVGLDVTPLMHFWGMHPHDRTKLKNFTATHNLPPSKKICDRLEHYKSVMAMDNSEFMDHYLTIFPNQPTGGHPDYGHGWYNHWKVMYGNAQGDSAANALQDIIDLYFPNGCPLVEETKDCNNKYGGTAFIDNCGDCAGGTTGIIANAACTPDCNKEVGGTASIDACGVCSGGATGIVVNSSCVVACNTTIQAEDAVVGGGASANTSNVGNYGTGYVNFPPTGGFTEFTVQGCTAGRYTLEYRHALGADTRSADLFVNGIKQTITVTSSGSWSTYKTQTMTINLNAGTNTIKIVSTGSDFGNLDQIKLTQTGITDCNGDIGGKAFVDNCGSCAGGATGVTVNSCVTTTDVNDADKVHVYPNPVQNQVNIEGEFKRWILTDARGAFIKDDTEKIIDVSALSPGLYYINVDGQVKKLIKY